MKSTVVSNEKHISHLLWSSMHEETPKDIHIIGDEFYRLLDYCFKECSIISFSNECFGAEKAEKFMRSIEKFHIKTLQTRYWYRCDYTPNVSDSDRLNKSRYFKVVHLYKAHSQIKDTIKMFTNNLFFSMDNKYDMRRTLNPNLPEDICFFRENKLLLGTTSHDFVCDIYPTTEQELEFFKELLGSDYYLEEYSFDSAGKNYYGFWKSDHFDLSLFSDKEGVFDV